MRSALFFFSAVLVGASLASQCTFNILNSYSGSTAGTPVNFACVEFQAIYTSQFDRSIQFIAAVTGSFDLTVYSGPGSCATTVTATGPSSALTATVNAGTALTSGSGVVATAPTLAIAAGAAACVCVGNAATAVVQTVSGAAKGSNIKSFTEPTMTTNNGGTYTVAGTAWTLINNQISTGYAQYAVTYPTLTFKDGIADNSALNGYRAFYVVPTAQAQTITLTVSRATNLNFRSSAVTVATYTTFGDKAVAGTDFTQTSSSLSWALGDGADKTVAVSILARDPAVAPETVRDFQLKMTDSPGSAGASPQQCFGSPNLRIVIAGCPGGSTCGGNGVCTEDAQKSKAPTCVCSTAGYLSDPVKGCYLPTTATPAATPAPTAAISSAPSTGGSSATPAPTGTTVAPTKVWVQRAITVTRPLGAAINVLRLVSTSKTFDTSTKTGTGNRLTVTLVALAGGDLRIRTTHEVLSRDAAGAITVTSTSSTRIRLTAIVEYVDAGTLNSQYDAGEEVRVYRFGRDTKVGTSGVAASSSPWTFAVTEGATATDPTLVDITDQGSVVKISFSLAPLQRDIGLGRVPPTQGKFDVRITGFPYKNTNSRLALITVVDSASAAATAAAAVAPGPQGLKVNMDQVASGTSTLAWTKDVTVTSPSGATSTVAIVAAPVTLLSQAPTLSTAASTSVTDTTDAAQEVPKVIVFSINAVNPATVVWDPLIGVSTDQDVDTLTATPAPTNATAGATGIHPVYVLALIAVLASLFL